MATVNISLPYQQIKFIDMLVSKYGFANRSEFFRSIFRLLLHQEKLVEKAAIFPFISPQTRSVKTIIADFKRTKKYSSAFLKDLEEGLAQSDYFKRR